MSYKRIIISLLILSLILIFAGCLGKLIPTTPEVAPPEGTAGVLYLEPAYLTLTPSQDFTVELKTTSITNLKGYSVTLSYDSALLSLKEVTEGSFFSSKGKTFFYKKADNTQGTVLIDCAILGPELNVSGEGTLATLSFISLKAGSTSLTFKLTKTRDTNNKEIITIKKDKGNNRITNTTGSGRLVSLIGDFNGDGYVQFEDLMIFAMAYGSCEGNANYNSVCDIYPDNCINFEDLMLFAMHYGECSTLSAPSLSDPGTSVGLGISFDVCWSTVIGTTGYKIQEATSSDFSSGLQEYSVTGICKTFSHNTSDAYYYRVAAINDCGQSSWSNVVDMEVVNAVVQRALLVGVGDYLYGDNDLSGPPYDVDKMHDTLNHSGDGFALINELKDLQATKSAILNGIANTFSQADANDISYFYFSGHGTNYEGISYIVPTDAYYLSDCISVNELESALNAIPGTKVVFLDSCYSGGFIGKEINPKDIANYLKDFNDDIINTFMTKDFTKDLANSQYQVLTACLSTQTSLELIPIEGNPFGLFSEVLVEGCGYNYYSHPYYADANANAEITLNEAYFFTDQQVNIIIDMLNAPPYNWGVDQDTQVYPENSNFVIIKE